MARGSRFLALVGAQGLFSHTRWSATIIHLPVDRIWAGNRTYSVVNQNHELYEWRYHGTALQLVCSFLRSTAEWIEYAYKYSLLQNLFMALGDHADIILATLAFYLGFPSSLTKEHPTKPATRIQKQEPKSRAKPNGAAKSKGKGRAVGTRKTPTDGPEDSEQSGDDSEHDGKGESLRGGRRKGAQVMGCPFYKLDPIAHYRCVAKHRIVGFNRLKQHIERCHSLKEFYCPLCWTKFTKAAARDQHIRLENCESRACTEDFMGDELHQLRNDVPSGSDEDKYFWVWDSFFKHPRPNSAYVFEGIWEPLSFLAGTANRNITTEDFSSWAQDLLCSPWEDVLPQLLTLRHERTQISRRVPLHSIGDTSILVNDDTHLAVLQYQPSNSNEIANPALLWPNVPTIGSDVNMFSSFVPSDLRDHSHPESSGPGNAADQSLNWNIEGIADNIAPNDFAPSGIPRPMEMEDLVDLDGGMEPKGSQE